MVCLASACMACNFALQLCVGGVCACVCDAQDDLRKDCKLMEFNTIMNKVRTMPTTCSMYVHAVMNTYLYGAPKIDCCSF